MEKLVKDYEKALESMIKVYGIRGDREDLTVEVILNTNHTGDPQIVRGKEEFVNNVLSSINSSVNVIELEDVNIIL
ncbi:hypothetical protein HOT02_gp034 [Staphylococcus phage phiSA_BS2]|uniref:Uncharacterized protein n=1 Tax=Staphylococcus phage phiSA_BS2 TaxID=2126724 RepID=A0A2R3ZXI5_9CAUD|nr:hypothetical protein HOT02_gp034 [Staphylococcus phage phiSA_BS2]AVR55479.1 hypothetical protein phiSABS2_34 [Staphylococcus phage phiSA_BS2]